MKIVLLLGKSKRYYGYKAFSNDVDLNNFIDSIENLMCANIIGELSLHDRQSLCPDYFSFAGAIEDYKIITVEEYEVKSE